MDPLKIIRKYYCVDSEAYPLLVDHSRQVASKAVGVAKMHPEMDLDISFIEEAAMVHDIGVFLCNAPDIGCYGDAAYICHGYLGAELMRREGFPRHAWVCERHTGTGISLEMIENRQLPLPHRDMRPQSLEEQLICFADKFYSKTKPGIEKPVEKIRQSLRKYGEKEILRFNEWYKLFLG